MKLNKTREDLELEIISMVEEFASTVNKSEIDLVAEHLTKHNIKLTDIYSIFNNANNAISLEDEELALLGEQLGLRLGMSVHEWKSKWFTKREIEEIERYQKVDTEKYDEFNFPHEFKNVSDLGEGYYLMSITKQEIGRLRKYGKFNYNENVQRGMKPVDKFGGRIYVPIVYPSKVEAIKQSALKGEAIPSTIILNAALMSATEGVELEYNSKKGTLTIHEGTILDIVDGMHRILGTYVAWLENKELEGSYAIIISNKSDEEVRMHQVDLDKSTPLTRGQVLEKTNDNLAREVINKLKTTPELKGKIVSNTDNKYNLKGDELLPYKTLSDIINRNFDIKNTMDAIKVSKQISEYNIYLFGYFGSYQNDKSYVLFDADVYEGHIALMKKMVEENIPFESLENIINIEDFNIENKVWKDVFEKKKVSMAKKNKIKDFFLSLIK